MPVSYLIANVSRAISRELAAFRHPGIAGPQVAPLLVLREEPGLSNAQLARRTHVTPQSMNEVVIGLEAEGFIERRLDANNRRILRAYLTPTGREMLRRWDRAIDDLEQRLFTGLGARDVEALRASLERCVENMRPRR